jgi:hypothetical protein
MRDTFLSKLMRECAMAANIDLPVNTTKKSEPKPSAQVWIGGVLVRTLFLIVLLGFGVCAWFIVNLFILPKDAGAYRTWMYLGVTVLPLALLCAFVVW